MWTFKKTEKREFYEEDIVTFKTKIVTMQGLDVNYHFINLFTLPYNKTKTLYNILFNNSLAKKSNYIIVDKDMLYTSLDNINVIGVSIAQLKYIGISRDKIINKIKNCKNNRIYYTSSKNMWQLKAWFLGKEYIISNIFEKNAHKT